VDQAVHHVLGRIGELIVGLEGLFDRDAAQELGNAWFGTIDRVVQTVGLSQRHERTPLEVVHEKNVLQAVGDNLGTVDGESQGLEPGAVGHDK
jgi:hypothetical protein